jgi:hypothetical protein
MPDFTDTEILIYPSLDGDEESVVEGHLTTAQGAPRRDIRSHSLDESMSGEDGIRSHRISVKDYLTVQIDDGRSALIGTALATK